MEHHIAQLNVGRAVAPLDSDTMAEFMALLDPDQFIVNMSVWESIDALWEFVCDGEHVAVMRRRREWFERHVKPFTVLWWIPAGHVPTTEEAMRKLAHLEAHGPTPDAFTFKKRFGPAGEPLAATAPPAACGT